MTDVVLGVKYLNNVKIIRPDRMTSFEFKSGEGSLHKIVDNKACFYYFYTMQHRYFIELAYDGTAYNGWQRQPNAPSVQGVLEDRLSKVLREPIALLGAGRTDSGVHASYYVAHFECASEIEELEALVFKLNSFLPQDIVMFSITRVESNVHARFDASERSYEYHVITYKDPFKRMQSYRLPHTPDFSQMNTAAESLLSYIDFTSFSKLHTDVKTNNCTIKLAKWEQRSAHHWVFCITADRFLRNMVRAIVGTLLDVGYGKLSVQEFKQVIEGKNRSLAGTSVPPQGLFLTNIKYPENCFLSRT